ncbi:MAG: tetratricopeptide repeat protein [Candidatus Solibacter usitatus]|nr:tetratricopeptide repeat protein [Candidatus Solibacter usitatus]
MWRIPALFLFVTFAGRAESFLVLPFFNQTSKSNLDWMSESIAETIREALVSEGFITVSREDRAEGYRRLSLRPYSVLTKASVLKLGEELDAEQIVFGRFEFKDAPGAKGSRGTLRISAQILNLHRVRSSPEVQTIGALEDLASLQNQIAWQALKNALPELATSEAEFRKRRPSIRLDAMEHYVRGLLAQKDEQKHYLFTQAARLDPQFPQPFFELGKMSWGKEDYRGAADWLGRVNKSSGQYREATFLRGLSRFYLGDYAAAQMAFESVLDEVPMTEVQNNLGACQLRRGLPSALESFRKAKEDEPSDLDYLFNFAYALWRQGEFDESAAHLREILKRDPADEQASLLLNRCQLRSPQRPGDPKTEGLERLKLEYNESVYLQLRSILTKQKSGQDKK